MQEEWLPIAGLEGLYEISNLGRCRQTKKRRGSRVGRLLKPYADKGGYLRLHVTIDPSTEKSISLHCAVAEAFIGKRPDGYEVNHRDGDKSNNRPDNLEYCSPSANLQHAYDSGLRMVPIGELNPRAKITAETALAIKISPLGARRLSRIHGLSIAAIIRIRAGKAWSHVVVGNPPSALRP